MWFRRLLQQGVNHDTGDVHTDVERIIRILFLFAGVIPFVNFINCIFQSLGGTTRELMIESYILLLLAVLFSLSILYTNSKETDCSAYTVVIINILSLSLLIVMIFRGGLTLYSLISSGSSVWIALIVLLVLTTIELVIRFSLTKTCWSCYQDLKEAEANNPTRPSTKPCAHHETRKPLLK